MNMTISILAEIPEELHESLTRYLEAHADWDQDRLFAAALSLFLLQNGDRDLLQSGQCDRRAATVYLDSVFKHSA